MAKISKHCRSGWMQRTRMYAHFILLRAFGSSGFFCAFDLYVRGARVLCKLHWICSIQAHSYDALHNQHHGCVWIFSHGWLSFSPISVRICSFIFRHSLSGEERDLLACQEMPEGEANLTGKKPSKRVLSRAIRTRSWYQFHAKPSPLL